MRIILFLILLCPSVVWSAFLNLPRDVNGWTIFTASNDTRLIYVSSSGDDSTAQYYLPSDPEIGSDPFNPTGTIKPYATFAAAFANVRDGFPDWVLFKRGETWIVSSSISINKSGRSLTEPLVVGAYGGSGDCPILNTTDLSSEAVYIGQNRNYIALFGLDFYCKSRNPDDGGTVISGKEGIFIYAPTENIDGILIEGCKFRWYTIGANLDCAETSDVSIELRRNTFADSYDTDAHSQGIYAHHITRLKLYQNYFIHCGWRIPSTNAGEDATDGQATIFNHSMYLSSNKIVDSDENVSVYPSASNIKVSRKEMTIQHRFNNDLHIGGFDSIQAGGNFPDDGYDDHLPDFHYINTVFTNGADTDYLDIDSCNGITLGGLVQNGLISNNLIMNYGNVNGAECLTTGYRTSQDVIWQSNVVYNAGKKRPINISYGAIDSQNIVFKDNLIQLPGITITSGVAYAGWDCRSEYSFSGNKYYAGNDLFYTNGVSTDYAGWVSWIGETGSSWAQQTFTDPTRDIDTYMTYIGETPATIDGFIAKCREQDRFSWDSRFTAAVVNDWIRAGFDLEKYKEAPTSVGAVSGAFNLN